MTDAPELSLANLVAKAKANFWSASHLSDEECQLLIERYDYDPREVSDPVRRTPLHVMWVVMAQEVSDPIAWLPRLLADSYAFALDFDSGADGKKTGAEWVECLVEQYLLNHLEEDELIDAQDTLRLREENSRRVDSSST